MMKNLVCAVAVVALLGWSVDALADSKPPSAVARTTVTTAKLNGTRVAPAKCADEQHACTGLTRGSTLDVELSGPGYAVAFLQDGHGKFYTQEGRAFIQNLKRGETKLWPGTDAGSEDKIFRLYIVSSNQPIPTRRDDEELDNLPEGEKWGPVYLSTGWSWFGLLALAALIICAGAVFAVLIAGSRRRTVTANPKNEVLFGNRSPAVLPTVFLGHGRNAQWLLVEKFLSREFGLPVQAFETQPRASQHISEILSGLLQTSDLAVIVLTAEDLTLQGDQRARQNVIHEVGLFQGRLGFSRVILLEQAGIEEPSNLAGFQTIRFASKVEDAFYQLGRELRHILSPVGG